MSSDGEYETTMQQTTGDIGNPGIPNSTGKENVGSGSNNNNSNLTKSETEVLRIKKTGKEIARKAIGAVHNYDKLLLKDIKANLLERDAELTILAGDFIDQEARIVRLRRTMMRMNREMTALKKASRDSADISRKLTDTLVHVTSQSVRGKSESDASMEADNIDPEEMADAGSEHGEATPDAKNGEPEVMDDEPGTACQKYFMGDPYYQESIKSLDLENLDMGHEAEEMVKPSEIDFDEEEVPFKYRVSPYLMGLITGRQKQTIRRIINQTSTEIEPISWAEDGRRQMGFKILGSQESIVKAINLMIDVVRTMDNYRAKRILKGHQMPEKKEPAPAKPATGKPKPTKPSTSKPEPAKASTSKGKTPTGKGKSSKNTGSKSSDNDICPRFSATGNCKYGSRCNKKHVRK